MQFLVLVEHGADPTARDKDGLTPLHVALQSGDMELALLLIEHGADVTAQKKGRVTPMHLASHNGDMEIT